RPILNGPGRAGGATSYVKKSLSISLRSARMATSHYDFYHLVIQDDEADHCLLPVLSVSAALDPQDDQSHSGGPSLDHENN
ncbi:hypothetical protein RYB05_19975, partial [Pseudomonas syringae pv. actinidiae]|nr:hypothetical protein [Pseudomonas syringae pv. actinidiae]